MEQPPLLTDLREFVMLHRPHSSLGNISPREFVAQWQLTEAAGGAILNLETV